MLKSKIYGLFAAFSVVLVLGLTFSSCGDDDVMGCTDPDAENYNAEATTDDGTCTYARDKFVGSYLGTFQCPGLLAIISSDSLVFTIAESLDPANKDEVIVTLTNVGGLTFDLTGTVSGNNLDINAELLGVPIQGVTGDVTGTGTGSLNADGTELTADITLTVGIPLLGINDTQTCTLVGTRQ